MWTQTFKVDPQYYGKWYNTAAGVGIKGNKADTQRQKPKGVPFKVLVGGFACLVAAAFCIPWLMQKAVGAGLERVYPDSEIVSAVEPSVKTAPSAVSRPAPVQAQASPVPLLHSVTTNGVPWVLEIQEIKALKVDRYGFVTMTLRDGKTLTSADGIQLLGRDGFKFRERIYPMP